MIDCQKKWRLSLFSENICTISTPYVLCSQCIRLRIAFFLIALETCSAITELSPTLQNRPDDELELDLEPINSTSDFRISITLDLTGKPWYDDRMEQYRCVRPAKCEKLQNSTCFGSKIQYKSTSVQLSDEESQETILKKLYQLEAFRNIPECWAVIQVNFSFVTSHDLNCKLC